MFDASQHVSDDLVAALLAGGASTGRLDAAHAHAAACTPCMGLLAEIGRVRAAGPSRATTQRPAPKASLARTREIEAMPLLPGERVGRFVVEGLVGAGGMGAVLAAHDATLQRRVAIKVLHERYAEDARFRLLREARAMASIEHPNVVNVFEAGEQDGFVYIAMELVQGLDARRWLDQASRPWAEVLKVWIAAGRGLAAAHERGLVHRDFKPHNVLISDDGRVLVTDFGLVSACGSLITEGDSQPAPHLGDVVTEAGTVVGTPRYMAPEQARGRPAAPAGDQYAFCVSLFEALMGQHPGEVRDPNRLRAMLPRGRRPPRRLLQCIQRGLHKAPERRHADIPALLRSLESIGSARQRRRRLGAATFALAGSLGVGALLPGGLERDRCPGASDELPGVWDDTTRARVESAVRGERGGDATWSRLQTTVDRYAATWGHLAQEACEATHERGEVSEALLDRRMACLARGRTALAESLDLVVTGRAGDGALELLYDLPDLRACEDLQGLEAADPRPTDPEALAVIERAERVHVRARALVVQGRMGDAIDTVGTVVHGVEWTPLEATLLGTQAEALFTADPTTAEPVWRRAYELATEAGNPRQLLRLEMVRIDGAVETLDVENAELWLGVAEARGRRSGDSDSAIDLARLRGDVERIAGRSAEAEASYREALALAESTGEVHEDLDVLHGDIGGMVWERGEYRLAFHHTDRAIEAAIAAFGPTHLRTLRWQVNRSMMRWARGDYENVEVELRDVIETAGDRVGLTGALPGLAIVLRREGRLDEATAIDRELVEDRTRRYGENAPHTAEALGKLALDLFGRGDLAEAESTMARAVDGLDDHPEPLPMLVELCADLALIRMNADDLPGAREAIDRGREELERLPGPSRKSLRFFDQEGRLLLAEGRPGDAAEAFRRGLDMAHRRGATPQRAQAALRFALARALLADDQADAARREAQHASDILAGLAQSKTKLGRKIADWLRDHA